MIQIIDSRTPNLKPSADEQDDGSFQIGNNFNNNRNTLLDRRSTYISHRRYHIHKNNYVKQEQEERLAPYHKWHLVEKLANASGKKGVTYVNVMHEFGLGKKAAMTMLHNYENKGKLYTAGRKRPQKYYLSSEEAEFHYLGSTHKHPSGVNLRTSDLYPVNGRNNPLNQYLDYQPPPVSEEADNLLEAMLKSERAISSPQALHNPHIALRLYNPDPEDDNPYDRIPDSYLAPGPEGTRNHTKLYRETVGDKEIAYRLSPNNGTVTIYIGCSDSPFPLDTEEHVDSLFNFIEGRREVLRIWLTDRSDQFVPPVSKWGLTECDLNTDVPITPRFYHHLHFKGGGMELTDVERTFRDYAKCVKGRFFLRREMTLGKKDNAIPLTKTAIYNLIMARSNPTAIRQLPEEDPPRGRNSSSNFEESSTS